MSNCPYCCWIDPTRLEADEVDGPLNYCRVCGRDLRVPVPDPDTGLVPCEWCGPERIGWFGWNRAMGWREGNEN